jgi:hypothetical protein
MIFWVRVPNDRIAKQLQEIAFKNGYMWPSLHSKVLYIGQISQGVREIGYLEFNSEKKNFTKRLDFPISEFSKQRIARLDGDEKSIEETISFLEGLVSTENIIQDYSCECTGFQLVHFGYMCGRKNA